MAPHLQYADGGEQSSEAPTELQHEDEDMEGKCRNDVERRDKKSREEQKEG